MGHEFDSADRKPVKAPRPSFDRETRLSDRRDRSRYSASPRATPARHEPRLSWPPWMGPPYDSPMRPVFHAHCPRARLRRRVESPCEVVRTRDFKLVGTRVINLSAKGMLIETELPI